MVENVAQMFPTIMKVTNACLTFSTAYSDFKICVFVVVIFILLMLLFLVVWAATSRSYKRDESKRHFQFIFIFGQIAIFFLQYMLRSK